MNFGVFARMGGLYIVLMGLARTVRALRVCQGAWPQNFGSPTLNLLPTPMRYILQVHPAAAPCAGDGVSSAGECVVREGEGGFESRELNLQLELGVEYEVTVSTVNCGTQAGNESDPIHILLHSKHNGTIETITHSIYISSRCAMLSCSSTLSRWVSYPY